MSMPFYVAPEQMMKDRADYARKGIARGRALVAATFDDGILVCAENPSKMLRKISEIYDRIGFAGVGKYNEFDQLRIAGVRHADLKGFSFSREDVDARSLANQYAQMLGQVFTHEMKPMEVEILVAEVGADADDDQLFHILYDGTLIDEIGWCVLGGEAEAIGERMGSSWTEGGDLAAALGARRRRARRSRPRARGGRARGGRARAEPRAPGVPPDRARRGRVAPVVLTSPGSRTDRAQRVAAWMTTARACTSSSPTTTTAAMRTPVTHTVGVQTAEDDSKSAGS